jgi:hypothetical protein
MCLFRGFQVNLRYFGSVLKLINENDLKDAKMTKMRKFRTIQMVFKLIAVVRF